MASHSSKNSWLYWVRFLAAIFALLVAAAHLASALPSGSGFSSHTTTANTPTTPMAPTFQEMGFWFDIEVIAYTIIAVLLLLGLRTWYIPSTLFNIFNVGLFFLSGFVAIPGITTMAYSRLGVFNDLFSTMGILVISWIALLIIQLILLKYDPGTELDKMLVTRE